MTINTIQDVSIDFLGINLRGDLVLDEDQQALYMRTNCGFERFSINLSQHGLVPPPGHVFIKDWSEHAGLARTLQDCGLIRIEGQVAVGPFASVAYLCSVRADLADDRGPGQAKQPVSTADSVENPKDNFIQTTAVNTTH